MNKTNIFLITITSISLILLVITTVVLLGKIENSEKKIQDLKLLSAEDVSIFEIQQKTIESAKIETTGIAVAPFKKEIITKSPMSMVEEAISILAESTFQKTDAPEKPFTAKYIELNCEGKFYTIGIKNNSTVYIISDGIEQNYFCTNAQDFSSKLNEIIDYQRILYTYNINNYNQYHE